MNLKQRKTNKSVLDVVLNNTGKSTEDFFEDVTRDYNIKLLPEVSKLIKDAIFSNTKITIVSDYDADGVTSSAILTMLLQHFGATPNLIIPKRMSEGYGISESIIDRIDKGLLITVDNGITANDAIQKAKDKGLQVVVIDHHLGPEDGILPPADLIIDPNAIENQADFNSYCGAGLSYKLAVEMLGPNDPVLKKMVAFAAIGTVADVMPLIEDNRNIVNEGLAAMKNKNSITSGLYALLNECCLEKYMNAKNIGFKIGPIINAPGRLFDDGAIKAYKALVFDGNAFEASNIAHQLILLNEERKELAKKGTETIEKNIMENCLYGDCPMVIYQPDLPEGLVGIFAGKIAEKYNTPCVVLTDSEDPDILKGSARSIEGIHLKNLLDKHSDLLERYGGHAEAAGLSLKRENLEEFREKIQEGVESPAAADDTIFYDLEITSDKIEETINDLEKYGPFGEGNPEPVILIKGLNLYPIPMGDSEFNSFARTMGENKEHLKLAAKDMDLVAFSAVEKYRNEHTPKVIDVVGCLSKNAWHSKITNQMEVIDFSSAEEKKEQTSFAATLASMAASR